MKLRLSPSRLALAGIAFFLGSVAWEGIWSHMARRHDPPGWIMDRASPVGPSYLAAFGAFLLLCAFIWALVVWIKRSIVRQN